MNSELYVAASGMLVEERRLETIANNLANLSSTGFRAQRLITRSFAPPDPRRPWSTPDANRVAILAGSYETPGPGPIRPTGRALDLVLRDGEFLELRTPAGPRYTRAGSLEISDAGELVDESGHPVLDDRGEPFAGVTAGAWLSADGTLQVGSGDERIELGRLRVVSAAPGTLQPVGRGVYTPVGGSTPVPVEDPQVEPGRLEGSGTEPLEELVRLIEAQRAFANYQKVISLTMNEVNRRAIEDLAG